MMGRIIASCGHEVVSADPKDCVPVSYRDNPDDPAVSYACWCPACVADRADWPDLRVLDL